MKKITSWLFLLTLASASMLAQTVTFTAIPNPLPAGVTTVTLTWNAPGHAQTDIHINSATGQVPFGTQGSSGSLPMTASWILPGLSFYLVDHGTSVTLATVTLTSTATISVSPNPLPPGVTAVTVSWSATGYTSVEIHTGSSAGPLFTTGGSSGSVPATGVTPGMSFYLVDHVSGTPLASVSILGDWNIPVANQSQCLPFPVLNQPATAGPAGYVTCWRVGYFHWFSIGQGWSTGFTLSNPTSYDMTVQVTVEDTSGNPYNPPSVVLNGSPLTLGGNSTAAGVLPRHSVLRFVFPNNGAPTITDGQIYLQVSAKDGLSLNTIQAVEDYTYTNPSGIVYSTVTVPMNWLDQANNSYSAIFEESSVDQSYGAFAVKDMSGSGQTVDVKLFDVNGNQLGDQPMHLAANQVMANTSDGLFGASAFHNLPLVPIVRLQFTGTGPIAVLVLQGRGQTVATIPPQPVLEQ